MINFSVHIGLAVISALPDLHMEEVADQIADTFGFGVGFDLEVLGVVDRERDLDVDDWLAHG